MALRRARRSGLIAGALSWLILGACTLDSTGSDTPERRAAAAEVAARYLAAVVGDEADYGWSMLFTQSQWQGYEHYERVVSDADWSEFEVSVSEALVCDDGWRCQVRLHVAGDRGSVPEFLLSTAGSAEAGIRFFDVPADCGNAELVVALPIMPWASSGVELSPP